VVSLDVFGPREIGSTNRPLRGLTINTARRSEDLAACSVRLRATQLGAEVRPGSTKLVPSPESRYSDGVALAVLTRQQTFAVLIACEPEIRALGVSRLALFGSVLRDQAGPDSDVDLLVQFTPGAKIYARFLELSELLEQRLGRPVELVTTDALSPFIGPRILAEAQDVLRAA
jgi:predicted nucleotidyltransferase